MRRQRNSEHRIDINQSKCTLPVVNFRLSGLIMAGMSIRKLVVLFLVPLWAASAQAPLPGLRVEPTDGGSILYIRNVEAQPLTGFLIELLNYPGSYYAYWQDDVTSAPIAAGAEQETRVANMTIGAVPDYVKMQAALYADGSSSGAAEKVALLRERREFTIHTLRTLIQRLEKAQAESMTKDAVIADLKQWSESMQPGEKPKRYSQADINSGAARNLIASAVTLVSGQSVAEALSAFRADERRVNGDKD